jgi:hypothetical protein
LFDRLLHRQEVAVLFFQQISNKRFFFSHFFALSAESNLLSEEPSLGIAFLS